MTLGEGFVILQNSPSRSDLTVMTNNQAHAFLKAKDDAVEWMDRLLRSIRGWKKKIDYEHFEKQLEPLRNLDRQWKDDLDDVQFNLLKSLFCFGLCLPSEIRRDGEEDLEAPDAGQAQSQMDPQPQRSRPQGQSVPDQAYPPQKSMSTLLQKLRGRRPSTSANVASKESHTSAGIPSLDSIPQDQRMYKEGVV